MNNNDIVAKRNQAIADANKVYNQIIKDQTNLVNDQSNQIDNYLANSQSAINQSVNNNISALNNASETARRQHEAEKQAIMNNYQNNANNIDETARIGYLNSTRNRIATSEGSLNDTIQEYNNQIAQAKITGESMIAQQALEMLKQKLNLHKTNVDTINDLNIGKLENKQQLRSDYATIDAGYSSARNAYLDRQQDYKLFNKEMAYNKQQLKQEKQLKEKEYQLDLRDAKESYYSRRSSSGGSSSGGGYALTDSSGGSAIGSSSSGNTKYYANYTPVNLSKSGRAVYDNLTSSVLKNGYVTSNQLRSSVSGLPKSQQALVLSAFKQGSTKPASSSSKKTTSKKSTKKTTTKKSTTKKAKTIPKYKKPSFKNYLK